MGRREKQQAKYDRRQAAAGKAAEKDAKDKAALQRKASQAGGAGKLSRREIKLARRMGDGEGR